MVAFILYNLGTFGHYKYDVLCPLRMLMFYHFI
jgi:hypothetical protein